MDQEEVRSSTTILEDNFASNLTTSLVGSDRGSNNSGTSSRQFSGNESNSLQVLVTVLAGVTEFCKSTLEPLFS